MKRFPPRRILAAADLAAPSLSALAAAKDLALRWDSRLDVVHVQHPPAVAAWVGAGLPDAVPHAPREMGRRVRDALRKELRGFPDARLKLRTIHGWPPNELAELAGPGEADLVVVGTHGYAGLDRLAFGSTAEAVVRRARVPVLAVHERRMSFPVGRILAPWNGRPYATRALRYAGELARGLGAELRVLMVDECGLSFEDEAPKLERRIADVLGGPAAWTLRVRRGEPREQIVREASSGRYGLTVLSAHRRRFSADVVLGSTVERVLRHSGFPVLAVPSGEAPPRLAVRPPSWITGKLYSA